MNEMIDRVARALFVAEFPGSSPDMYDLLASAPASGPVHVRHYGMLARAAIAAMREPTGQMKDAGAETFRHEGFGQYSIEGQPSASWNAMIDAILSEKD